MGQRRKLLLVVYFVHCLDYYLVANNYVLTQHRQHRIYTSIASTNSYLVQQKYQGTTAYICVCVASPGCFSGVRQWGSGHFQVASMYLGPIQYHGQR